MENSKICSKCGATWINGQHYWATGNKGNEDDLAGLVCNKLGDDTCINSKKGSNVGDTWASRLGYMESAMDAKKKMLEDLREQEGE